MSEVGFCKRYFSNNRIKRNLLMLEQEIWLANQLDLVDQSILVVNLCLAMM